MPNLETIPTAPEEPPSTGARSTTAIVLAAALGYAVLRYVLVGTVPASQLPVFILNKAIAVASIVLIAICLAIGPLVRLRLGDKRWIAARKRLGVHGFVLAAVHAVLTIAILSPASYGKLHDATGRLTFDAGLAILAGVIALAALFGPAVTSTTIVRRSMNGAAWRRTQRTAITALAVGLGHVVALGWRSWLTPAKWPGGLPPLTTIAVAAAALSLAIRGAAWLRRRPRPALVPVLAAASVMSSRDGN